MGLEIELFPILWETAKLNSIVMVQIWEVLQFKNTISKVADIKLTKKKSALLLYTNDKWAEIEIRETKLFAVAANSIKYFSVCNSNEANKRPTWQKHQVSEERNWRSL